MTIAQARILFAKAFKKWNEDNATRMAASLSFYAILALAPLTLFAVAGLSHFLDQGSLRATIVHEARMQLGQGAADLVKTLIDGAAKPAATATAGIVSLVLALLGASGLFDQLNIAMSSIWKVGPRKGHAFKNFVIAKFLAVLMVLIFITLILAWVAMDSVLAAMRHYTGRETHPLWRLASVFASIAFLTGLFGVTFKSLPKGLVGWKDVWFAAFTTAVGFTLSKYLLGLYFGLGHIGTAYGPAGALIVILLWFYYSSQIFFFGAELAFVHAYEHGSHRKDTPGELEVS